MQYSTNYDPNEELPSPLIEAVNHVLNLSSIFDFNDASTPPGIDPSHRPRLSSPLQTTTLGEIFPFDELGGDFDGTEFPFSDLTTALPNDDNLESLLSNVERIYDPSEGLEDEKLRIISEPKAFYRERYFCETDPNKHRAQRYIRTANTNKEYEYPTLKIPPKWCDRTRHLYIQVIPVTITNNNVSNHCIHPYPIDTQDHAIKDPKNNTLYFPIDENEMAVGEKRFHISRKKMVQNELKSYGPLRLFNSNQPDEQRVLNPLDAKQIIATYQLSKSQFVFTIAERHDTIFLPNPIRHTSVHSQVMTDVATDGQNASTSHSHDPSTKTITCIPQKGDWQGGDEVLLVLPSPIKQKVYKITFDFGSHGQAFVHDITPVDRKTLLFRTPPYPLLPGDENLHATIIINENSITYPAIDFTYITPMRTTMNICPRCQERMMNNCSSNSNKRRCEYVGMMFETDCGNHLVSQMNDLALEQKKTAASPPTPPPPRLLSDEGSSKVDKYLNQLKDALAIFVRTNDPSRLFRRTRVLLSNCDENTHPLHDAIEHGHAQLALSFIRQIIDMSPSNGILEKVNENGETALLIACKCNEWKLVEEIVSKRSDLTEQKEKNGNNMLHLLASLNEDKGAEIIENVQKLLPSDLKTKLTKEKNKTNQTAREIAMSQGNTQCFHWLKLPGDSEEVVT